MKKHMENMEIDYSYPRRVEGLEVFGLAVIFGFSLLTQNILLVAAMIVITSFLYPHLSSAERKRASNSDFTI